MVKELKLAWRIKHISHYLCIPVKGLSGPSPRATSLNVTVHEDRGILRSLAGRFASEGLAQITEAKVLVWVSGDKDHLNSCPRKALRAGKGTTELNKRSAQRERPAGPRQRNRAWRPGSAWQAADQDAGVPGIPVSKGLRPGSRVERKILGQGKRKTWELENS